jgi:hypothetical protein
MAQAVAVQAPSVGTQDQAVVAQAVLAQQIQLLELQ